MVCSFGAQEVCLSQKIKLKMFTYYERKIRAIEIPLNKFNIE